MVKKAHALRWGILIRVTWDGMKSQIWIIWIYANSLTSLSVVAAAAAAAAASTRLLSSSTLQNGRHCLRIRNDRQASCETVSTKTFLETCEFHPHSAFRLLWACTFIMGFEISWSYDPRNTGKRAFLFLPISQEVVFLWRTDSLLPAVVHGSEAYCLMH